MSFLNRIFGKTETSEGFGGYMLTETDNERWAIVDSSSNGVVASYARKRDAIRGADRRGILLANV